MERAIVATAEQGLPGGCVQQGCLKYAGHHQYFSLIETEQALAVHLRDLHGFSGFQLK